MTVRAGLAARSDLTVLIRATDGTLDTAKMPTIADMEAIGEAEAPPLTLIRTDTAPIERTVLVGSRPHCSVGHVRSLGRIATETMADPLHR
jgi:hypothetical protein